ncbi:hypothetical protein GMOD_00002467 [Pyrenophora seminiperda CCB06]|uniref:Uncharacterized protein n=1 Tax=Pyrenophora seminiperda CCB06 TaxID=1302712 RepID=A0A3M7M2J6_9PLEO|nr:hypothetical protein GMOD_00002467 [Pyrenophora seminiperda CCB06]
MSANTWGVDQGVKDSAAVTGDVVVRGKHGLIRMLVCVGTGTPGSRTALHPPSIRP